MALLERSELEASPLADLHAIADQLGLDGFRRLRKAELIDAILGAAAGGDQPPDEDAPPPPREGGRSLLGRRRRLRGSGRARRTGASGGDSGDASAADESPPEREPSGDAAPDEAAPDDATRPTGLRAGRDTVEGVVELVANGSAFLRVAPPGTSDDDVYISAAQVRRCELVAGDRVSGPVRAPRRSERYPSLVRVDAINGAPADAVSGGTRYEELPVSYPTELLALESSDPTLQAIARLVPLGRGSRAVIVGSARAGKTELIRALAAELSRRADLEVSVVLAGARPEEIAAWQEGERPPVAALSFAESADAQGQAIERAVDAAKRLAARGTDAVVLIDGLDGVHPHAARKVLAAARNLRDAGSLTIIATAARPFGGETAVIALDAALTSSGSQPALDLLASGTLRPELLVGDEGVRAITQARAAALEDPSQRR